MLRYSTYQSIYDRKPNSRSQGTLRTIASRLNEGLTNSISNIVSKITLFKVMLFILLVATAWAGMVTVVASSPDHEYDVAESVVVKRGDSLWKIAADHKPSNMDTRIYIDAIKRANSLKGSNIQPGDILVMPAR
ncbi:LysM peptidoglycan-binding domain-containing protein [Paenibacillus bouchesdurhonensis]|uniref:LysM peptidoglycan-binding domain-containing protein n=1 Tax=Paenibacillus bouchesdurhonensis TaxID=1870990 RepID=UPI000DA60A14|nr:LysM peptidoglycan-binding domain-containing protein [Paenibacillus bouchesdurhonensis]